MPIDIYTYNERIAKYIGELFGKEVEFDDSEQNNAFVYFVIDIPINVEELGKRIKTLDSMIDVVRVSDVRTSGGYIVRDSKTGEFLFVKKSLAERIASESRNN